MELPEWATRRENGCVEVETAAQALAVLGYLEDDDQDIIVTDPIEARMLSYAFRRFGLVGNG